VSLAAGSRLGPYEILSPLGAGGMGEVYRAKDTRLDRTVAIKVLPSHLSSSPESRQRFEREAKTISQLSHPHICALHDVGNQDGVEFLVMEYLEGETLAERLAKGSLPRDQTLRFGIQIGDALDKAHRQGIVHRDLKPGNVMITKSGVKLLDFGLAKALSPARSALELTSLPTQAAPVTREGTLLGTVQYMAPEQLEGREADARSDIFAFGCVLYEMATGKKSFSGATQASLISSILRDEPQAVSHVQPTAPNALDHVVKTALAKDPDDRWQTAHDVVAQLKWIQEGGSAIGMPAVAPRRNRERLAWVIAGILFAGLAAALVWPLRRPSPPRTVRFSVAPPQKAEFVTFPEAGSLALSPDGKSLALVASTGGGTSPSGKRSLWVRRLDALAATELNGTEGAVSPFWSPDGRFIGYFAGGKLQKIAATGGPPQAICDSAAGSAGTWGRDGTILFSEFGGREGIFRVSAAGGSPAPVIPLDRAHGAQAWPVFLPDGKHFLIVSGAFGSEKEIRVGSLGSRQTRPILNADSRVAYCPPGYLLFARDGSLLAQPFDARALRATGDPIPISDSVWMFRSTGNAAFAVSGKGDVAYLSGQRLSPLKWRERTGRETGVAAAPGAFGRPRLSPDGSRIAVQVADPRHGTRDIWIYDAERGLAQRLTEDPLDAVAPIWSPGGDRIVFGSGRREGGVDIYVKPANGAGSEELILKEKGVQLPQDWSPDGSEIVYEDYSPARSPQRQLWLLRLAGKRDRSPLLRTSFPTSQGRYSPDGKWLAFVSEETGRPEVSVVAATGQGAVRRVSASGGSLPRWKRDGKELFYLADNGDLVSVGTQLSGDLRIGSASVLFTANPPPRDFDVSPDGRRFLFLEGGQGDIPRTVDLTVISNWTAELPKR
jgi:serine/threonine protein kinase